METGGRDQYSAKTTSASPNLAVKEANVNKKTRRLYTGFSLILVLMLIFVALFWRDFQTVQVSGDSMLPTFHSGERLLVSRAYWLVGPIQDNDVVVIRTSKPGEYIIKRVYRMAGEDVDFLNVPQDYQITQGKYVVPPGTIYVLGDNLPVSEDSRKYGPFDLDDVIGKVVLRR